MQTYPPASEAALEALSDAHDTYLRAGDFLTCKDPRAHIRASNIMFDAAIACGFDRTAANCGCWVAGRMTAWRREREMAPEMIDA